MFAIAGATLVVALWTAQHNKKDKTNQDRLSNQTKKYFNKK